MPKSSAGIKLGIAFGLLISILIGVGWLGLSRTKQVNAGASEILNQDVVKLELAKQAVSFVNVDTRMMTELVLAKHPDKQNSERYPVRHMDLENKIAAIQTKIREAGTSDQENHRLTKIEETRVPAAASVNKIADLLRTPGKESEARKLMTDETAPLLNQYRAAWADLIHFEDGAITSAKERNEEDFAATQRLSMLLVLAAILVAIGIAAFVTRVLSREIREREEAKLGVRRLNEKLEEQVNRRTEDLARTVEALQTEVLERNAKEQEFRRLAAIVEGSDDAIIAGSLDGIITDWNAGAERMLGFTREEVIGKSFSMITPRELSHEPRESQAKLLRGEAAARFESVRVRKNGEPVDVAIVVSPILNERGRIVGGSAILRDITERKIVEDALRRSEATYRSFVDNAPYGILRTTLDGRIVKANPALVEMLGYASEREVLALRMDDVYLHREDREESTRWCRQQDTVQGIEVEWKHKSGRPFTIRSAAHVVKDSKGNIEFLEGFVEDISERRGMELQLRQALKMEAIGRLAGGVAHDFNNLLGVIIGYGDLAAEQAGPNSALHGAVEQIRKAAIRASTLTRQLLAFSRQQVLEMRVLNLNSIVAEIGKMLQPLLGKDIHLETVLDPDLGQVRADQGQVEQVLMNLAVNARDAMPDGGRLLIRTANVSVDQEFAQKHQPMTPGEYVKLTVMDTGMGMDALTQAHIFEPFFTTKAPGKGTGLGLATVYGFVKQSGGFIWVESEPGAGATFTIYLPMVCDAASQQARELTGSSGRSAGTILLVEDEESLRELTRNLLEQGGYTVMEACDGADAIRIARGYKGQIHLLLTDMVMPGMNGRTLAEKLTKMYPDMRIAYMSGYTGFSESENASLDAAIIAKPFTRESLLQKVSEVLNMEQNAERV